MGTKIYFPSLSEDGWVDSSTKIADYLMSHFLLADKSQTYIYSNYVHSFVWILQNTQGDTGKMLIDVRTSLDQYFSKYFDNVVVEVTEIPNVLSPSKVQISLYVAFTDSDGKEVIVGKMVRTAGTIIESIININNA